MSSPRFPIVFDNDCLSSFLWVRRTEIIRSLFSKKMIVPNLVVSELEYLRGRYSFVCDELDNLIEDGHVTVETVPATGPLATEFTALESGVRTAKPLGKGEAGAIVLTRHLQGTLGSNNLADISEYCVLKAIPYICTDNILYQALERGIISLAEGERIWQGMKRRKRLLPAYSFEEAVRRFRTGVPR